MSDLARRALELAEKATPGPWGIDGSDSTNWGVRSVADDQPIISAMTRARGAEAEADAEFIAFARTALPALAERCLALEALYEYAEHGAWRCHYRTRYKKCVCGLDELCERLGLSVVAVQDPEAKSLAADTDASTD